MKPALGSLLCGAAPVLLVLALFGRWSRRDAAPPEPALAAGVAPPVLPAGAGAAPFDAWQDAAARSEAESIAYLEALDADGVEAVLRHCPGGETRQLAFARLVELDVSRAFAFAARWPLDEQLAVAPLAASRWVDEDAVAFFAWLTETERAAREDVDAAKRWGRFLEDYYHSRAFSTPARAEVVRAWRTIDAPLGRVAGWTWSSMDGGLVRHSHSDLPAFSYWTLINAARESGDWRGTMDALMASDWRHSIAPDAVAEAWLSIDVEAALRWAGEQTDPGRRQAAVTALLPVSGGNDAALPIDTEAVYGWVLTHAPDQFPRTFSEGDAPVVTALAAAELPADPSSDRVRGKIAGALAEHDLEAAIAWAESIGDERGRELTLRGIARAWGQHEPWAAEHWAREELGWSDEECARWFR